ncbi:MAG TPA: glycoside hydrolase family 43 protein [Acidimicrobiales bacterium]|nr:glycoside hydrolase family 43 protein [Acidimicrobiales bacterium]
MPRPVLVTRARAVVLGVLALVVTASLGPVVASPPASAAPAAPRTASVVATAPVYDLDAPDPDIIRVGSTYYVYTTAGNGGHIPVLSSTDLQHWSYAGDALPVLPPWERAGQTWAPGVVILGDQYVMYYATARRTDGEECISEATSLTPTGPFVDSSASALICQPDLGGSLDPQPFVDPSGTPFLYWKSNGGNGGLPIPGNIWVAQLSPDGSAVVGDAVNVLTETQSWETTVENPFMVYESGSYILFYSAGLWNSAGYAVSYAVCDGPVGPCNKPVGSPVLHSDVHRLGPGGESLVTDAQGNWWMAYAAWDGPASDYSYAAGDFRSLWIAPVTFVGAVPDIAAGEAPEGYDMSASDGGIFSFGAAAFRGSMGGQRLSAPIVGMAADPAGGGYWEVAIDGGVFAFGDAGFYGSMGGKRLAGFVVAMAATPDGRGYWLVATDGGVFAFGDAVFYGSTGNAPLTKPVIAMDSTPDGRGYWLVASDGGVFAFGDAAFDGSTGGVALTKPVVGMAAMPQGGGYWLVASDGGVFAFGAAQFFGSTGGVALARPIVALIPGPGSGGYWMVASDGGVFAFGDSQFLGSMGAVTLTRPVVGGQSA